MKEPVEIELSTWTGGNDARFYESGGRMLVRDIDTFKEKYLEGEIKQLESENQVKTLERELAKIAVTASRLSPTSIDGLPKFGIPPKFGAPGAFTENYIPKFGVPQGFGSSVDAEMPKFGIPPKFGTFTDMPKFGSPLPKFGFVSDPLEAGQSPALPKSETPTA